MRCSQEPDCMLLTQDCTVSWDHETCHKPETSMTPVGAAIVRLITGAHARWVGVAPVRADGAIPQRVYFANHTSHLDAPVIWASLPHLLRKRTRPVAGKDYWERGALRRFIARYLFRAVLIERKHVTKSNNPMRTMDAVLSAG